MKIIDWIVASFEHDRTDSGNSRGACYVFVDATTIVGTSIASSISVASTDTTTTATTAIPDHATNAD
jgi:hypothetical protein